MSDSKFPTPEDAEQAFYDAFQRADPDAMMDVWADRAFIECIHPMSERIRGRAEVASSWRRLFRSGLQVRIARAEVHRMQDALLSIHVLYEHLHVPGREAQYPVIIATNIYQLIEGSWRMVLHHASPSPGRDTTASNDGPAAAPRGQPLH